MVSTQGISLLCKRAIVTELGENRTVRLLWATHVPGGSDSEATANSPGDPPVIPGLGRFPGEGNGNPL